jgi:N-dimethylarginine dimethylaminohydrolase
MGSALISSAPTGARSFVGTIESAAVRARGDGTAPTTSEGQLIANGDTIYLGESEFSSMEFIRDASTDVELRGHFYNVEVDVILGKVS